VLIEQCKKEWEKEKPVSYADIVREAEKAPPFTSFINPDAPCFAAPISMIDAIQTYCKETNQPIPQTMGEIARVYIRKSCFPVQTSIGKPAKAGDFQSKHYTLSVADHKTRC